MKNKDKNPPPPRVGQGRIRNCLQQQKSEWAIKPKPTPGYLCSLEMQVIITKLDTTIDEEFRS